MSTNAIDDVEIKTVGAQASDPMGNGLIINVATKSGGNEFQGTVGLTYQPLDWNSDNAGGEINYSKEAAALLPPGGVTPGGSPTLQEVKQFDYSFGGLIARDKVWFFHTGRFARNSAAISRTGREVDILEGIRTRH